MNPENELFAWELRQIFLDKGFIFKILIGMGISLLLLPFLLNSLTSITKDVSAPNLPFVYKIVTVGVVGANPALTQILESDTLVRLNFLEKGDALRMLQNGELSGVLVLSGNDVEFIGAKTPLSSLAEIRIRDGLDKYARPQKDDSLTAIQKQSVEPFIRSIIAPFIIFSPLLLWCLPIIQSISYDRQNRMLEALFSLPVGRRRILLSKIGANFVFAIIASAFWVGLLALFNLNVSDPIGTVAVLSSISFMVICLNSLVSTITSNVKNATLAAGITSTVVFSFLFIVSLLRLNPYLADFAALSPVTFVSYQVAAIASPFPFAAVGLLVVVSLVAIFLSLSAFSTETFAFSQNPGVSQLYEGMNELIKNPPISAIFMGMVAFSLTFPVQIIALGIMLFISSSQWGVVLFLAAIEEILKFLAVRIIAPKDFASGAKFGFLVGIGYGLCESLLLFPFFPNISMRLIPIVAHGIFSSMLGIGIAIRRPILGLGFAILLHFAYNLILVLRFIP